MDKEPALLLPKLHLPPVRPDPVARPRLWAPLDEGIRRGARLTVFSAPPGYGKTTLAAGWAQRWAVPAAWVSLDVQDNDPARFLLYLRAALRQLADESGPELPSLTAALNRLEGAAGLRLLILDDYHWIVEPAVHEVVALLLEHQPAALHCVLLTREEPPLPLARLRARGQLVELRAADLQFTAEEAAEFLNRVMALALSPAEVAALVARTEGWAVGLQLAALTLEPGAAGDDEQRVELLERFSGGERFVDDYLAEEVLARQPPAVRRFLLQTAILERLCGPLCDALLDGGDDPVPGGSAEALIRLERANLFLIPLDRERRWYRYHALFADWLRRRLERTAPDALPALHRRAAGWYAAQGLVEPAIGHALAAGDYAAAAGWIDTICWSLRVNGELRTLLDWLGALPQAVVTRYPRLCIGYAEALMHGGPWEAAGFYLEAAERALEPAQVDLRCQAATFQAGLAAEHGDRAGAAARLQEARALLTPENTYAGALIRYFEGWGEMECGNRAGAERAFAEAEVLAHRAGHFYIAIVAHCDRATVRREQGAPAEALRLYREALAIAAESGLGRKPVVGIACIHLGEALLAAGELEEATAWVEKGRALCRQGGIANRARQAEQVLQQIAQARAHSAGAGSRLPEALTEREREVLQWVAQGASNREIAAALVVTVGTVKTHLSRLMGKLGAANRTAAVVRARELGLL